MNDAEKSVVLRCIGDLQSLLQTGTSTQSPVVVPPVIVPPPYVPPVVPAPIGRGDLVWPMSTTTLFPGHPGASVSGDAGFALQFVADNVKFPNGIIVTFNDQTGLAIAKDFVLSATPHDYTPIGPYAKAEGSGSSGGIAMRFGPPADGSRIRYDDTVLVAGATYYINFRQWATPRTDIVWSQFMAQAR